MVNFTPGSNFSNGLLVRSTSIQHTTVVIDKIKAEFQGLELDIVTHPHMIKGLKESFPEIEMIPFSRRSSFGIKGFLAAGLRKRMAIKKKYDIVFLPVENISGTGYENVLTMILLLLPKKIAICNKAGEINLLSFNKAAFHLITYYLYFPMAGAIAAALTFKWIFNWIKNFNQIR